jgi:hypothetical protein
MHCWYDLMAWSVLIALWFRQLGLHVYIPSCRKSQDIFLNAKDRA